MSEKQSTVGPCCRAALTPSTENVRASQQSRMRDHTARLGFLPWLVAWLILVLGLACFYGCVARADDIYFPLGNLTTGSVTNRKVLITPLELYPATNQMAVYDRTMLTSTTNGTLTISNMVQGLYRADIQAPPQLTSFYFFVPTNGTGGTQIYVNTILRATPQQVARPQDYAYSATASDARYATTAAVAAIPIGVTNGQSGVILPSPTTTNLASYGGTVTINTNGGDSVLFKNANGTSLLTWDDAAQQFHFNTNFPISGNGSTLQFLEAGNITSGTVAPQRLPQNQTNDLNTGLSSKIGNATNDLNTVTAARDMAKTSGTGYSNTLYSANIPTLPLVYFVTFDNSIDGQVHAYASPDGEHVLPAGTDPLVTVNTTAAHFAVRDPRLYNRSNVWYMFTGYQYTGDNHFRVFSTTNFPYGWTSNQVITAYPSGTTWDPTPFYDPADGQLHLIFSQSANGVTGFQQYEIHLTNQNDMTSWSSATKLSGTIWTNSIGPCPVYWNGTYYLFAKQEDQVDVTKRYTYLASAPALLGPYTVIRSNNWMNLGYGYEGFSMIQYGDKMRGYIDDNGAGTGAIFTECPMTSFPTGTWSSAVTVKGASYGFANPGAVILTNAVDQINVMRAATFGNNQSKSPFDLWHYPSFDYCVAANLTPAAGNSTTRAAWNTMSLVVTNNYGMEMFMDYAGGNTPTWYFITYAKGTGGVSINPANITSAGFNGTFNGIVAGTTVSASTIFSGATYKITSATTLPTVAGTDVVICNSNKVIYGVSATKTNLISDLR